MTEKDLASLIKKHKGGNPFLDFQAREYRDQKVIREFFPTITFWDRFHDQDEILLGKRGSGKTMHLRMLSFSLYKQLDESKALYRTKHKYAVGIYIPLRLGIIEYIDSAPGEPFEKTDYFSFTVNCLAISACLGEMKAVACDILQTKREQLAIERELIDKIGKLWKIENYHRIATIEDLQVAIDIFYQQTTPWKNNETHTHSYLAKTPLHPFLGIIKWFDSKLSLDKIGTTWMACFDEAEYLDPAYQKVLNSLIRSEKKPFSVKVATLPYRWKTLSTLKDQEIIRPKHDFSYIDINFESDSKEFQQLTESIFNTRIKNSELLSATENASVTDFMGGIDNPSLKERCNRALPNISDSELDSEMISMLSPERQEFLKNCSSNKKAEGTLKRFRPLYFLRKLYIQNSKGGTVAPYLVGADVLRKLSDGNPRRFIQFCSELFDGARKSSLTAKAQHRILMRVSKGEHRDAQIVRVGTNSLFSLLDRIGKLFSERFHAGELVDLGSGFNLNENALADPEIRALIEEGVAHCYIILHKEDTEISKLGPEIRLRLCSATSATFWLPLRFGSQKTIGLRALNSEGKNDDSEKAVQLTFEDWLKER